MRNSMAKAGPQPTGYENFSRLVQLSLTFFVLFCAFFTCQNMASLVLQEDGLQDFGFYTLATLYFSIAISSLMSTALLKKLGIYKCLILGGFGHFCFVFAQIFPAIRYDNGEESTGFFTSDGFIKTLLIICALINGFGAAIIWVANGSYIAECATPKTKGFFFGFFWFVYQSSQSAGSVIGALILRSGRNQTFFYLSLGILAALASLSFWFIRKPIKVQTVSESGMRIQASQLSHLREYMTEEGDSEVYDESQHVSREASFRAKMLGESARSTESVPRMKKSPAPDKSRLTDLEPIIEDNNREDTDVDITSNRKPSDHLSGHRVLGS